MKIVIPGGTGQVGSLLGRSGPAACYGIGLSLGTGAWFSSPNIGSGASFTGNNLTEGMTVSGTLNVTATGNALNVTPGPASPARRRRSRWTRSKARATGLLAALALLVHGKTPFVVLLAANAASYVVAGLLVLQLPAVAPPEPRDGDAAGYREVLHDRAYVGLALLNVIMALHDSLLLVAMPLWIVTRTKAPLPLTGLLFALNTVLVVLLQVRATRNIGARGGITRSYRIVLAEQAPGSDITLVANVFARFQGSHVRAASG